MASMIHRLQPNQQLRLTTAREGFNLRSIIGYLRKKHGINVSTFIDGEDVIVQRVELTPSERANGRRRGPHSKTKDGFEIHPSATKPFEYSHSATFNPMEGME